MSVKEATALLVALVMASRQAKHQAFLQLAAAQPLPPFQSAPTYRELTNIFSRLWSIAWDNHRKEFFRVPLDRLKQEIIALGIDVQWSLASDIDPTDYLETKEIERRIESDPGERASWLRSQKQRFGLIAGERPAWASLIEGAAEVLDDLA